MEKENIFRYRVSHTTLGEVIVEAPGRLNALYKAAQIWGKRWTEIARECIICQLGEVRAKPKNAGKRKEKRK